jgi:hypothetical protein
MGLHEDLRLLAEQFKKRIAVIKGEEATKQALVLPFLQTLGYDIYDPSVVQPEYVADFAKRRSGGPAEKVDYAIHKGGQPAIFIECKALDTPLDAHDPQLARYFNAITTVKLAVITDGVRYRFFTDLTTPNVMDASPFFVFNALAFSERDVEHLALFTFSNFSVDAVQAYAQDLIFMEKVAALVGDLLRNPSEPFVRFLIDQMEVVQGRVTARVVERVTPVVRKAIRTTIVEMMTKSIAQEMPLSVQPDAIPSTAPSGSGKSSPEATPTPSSVQESSKGAVETTGEELAIFNLVGQVCHDTGLGVPIAYKDTVSYFGINLGKVTRWFVRVFANGGKKSAVFRVTPDQAARLDTKIDVEPTADGRVRYYYQTPEDFMSIRSLIALAYKLEAARKDDGGSEDAS